MSALSMWRLLLGALLALALGAMANFAFVDVPGQPVALRATGEDWTLPQSPRPAPAMVEAAWEKSPPWPQSPPPQEVAAGAAEAPEVPPPVPVGVARSRNGARAVFSVAGAGTVLLRAGDPLPGGGRVLRVSGLSVEWRDAKGERQQREMFNSYQIQEEAAPAPAPASKPPTRKGRR